MGSKGSFPAYRHRINTNRCRQATVDKCTQTLCIKQHKETNETAEQELWKPFIVDNYRFLARNQIENYSMTLEGISPYSLIFCFFTLVEEALSWIRASSVLCSLKKKLPHKKTLPGDELTNRFYAHCHHYRHCE